MNSVLKVLAATIISVGVIGASAASAADRGGSDRRYDDRRYDDRRSGDYRPDRCDHDHDHRSHAANYYDYYAPDRYSRAGPYVPASRNDYRYAGRYDDRYARGYRGSRVLSVSEFNARGHARIVVTEVVYFGGRNDHLVCFVETRGRDGRFVPPGQLRSVAARRCSRRAEIRILG